MPMAINLDSRPGPDGFAIKIYGGNRTQPKPIAIEDGALEILMYDGVLTAEKAAAAKPLRVWTFNSDQLRRFMVKSSIGVGYNLTLRWEENRPTQSRVTLVARYSPPKAEPIVSAPSSLAVVLP